MITKKSRSVLPVIVEKEIEARINSRRAFMQGVFEDEFVVPLPEESAFEEDPIVRSMYADELANPGMRIVSAGHLNALKAANSRLMNVENILKEYSHLLRPNSMPSNTAFDLQSQNV